MLLRGEDDSPDLPVVLLLAFEIVGVFSEVTLAWLRDAVLVTGAAEAQARLTSASVGALKQVLVQQKLEKDGIKEVGDDTGYLKNTTGPNPEKLKKLDVVEKKADPAVLRYEVQLLAPSGGAVVAGLLPRT
ncbi:hypothetical protein PR003_g17381 [Phytophthora rubi]|uniref:Uncharacterized protein n=1 Tax=Phytophthora rubi TaxID=129364 RepID=A0A6A4ECR2_9STRA|nr:hypothetical protein PR003_g17381 [Phytophthora rubi]